MRHSSRRRPFVSREGVPDRSLRASPREGCASRCEPPRLRPRVWVSLERARRRRCRGRLSSLRVADSPPHAGVARWPPPSPRLLRTPLLLPLHLHPVHPGRSRPPRPRVRPRRRFRRPDPTPPQERMCPRRPLRRGGRRDLPDGPGRHPRGDPRRASRRRRRRGGVAYLNLEPFHGSVVGEDAAVAALVDGGYVASSSPSSTPSPAFAARPSERSARRRSSSMSSTRRRSEGNEDGGRGRMPGDVPRA